MEPIASRLRRAGFAAVAFATALSPSAYDPAARRVAARQIYFSAWQILPGFTAVCAALSWVLIRIVIRSSNDYGLSGYALASRKDFSFIGGFLTVGILVAFFAGLGAVFFDLHGLSLAVSAMFVLLMSGLILYETSNIIHGGETNYLMATVTLYVSIFNLFTSLLQLLGFAGRDD